MKRWLDMLLGRKPVEREQRAMAVDDLQSRSDAVLDQAAKALRGRRLVSYSDVRLSRK